MSVPRVLKVCVTVSTRLFASYPHFSRPNLKSKIFLRLLGDKSSAGVSNSLFLVCGVSFPVVSLSLSVSVTALSDPELRYHTVLDLGGALLLAEYLGRVLLWYVVGAGRSFPTSRLVLRFRLCRRSVRRRKLVGCKV